MKKIYAVFIILLLIASLSLSFAADDYETLVIPATATGFTSSKITTSGGYMHKAYCTLEGSDIRYTIDGTTPSTNGTGHLLEISGNVTFSNYGDILNFRAVTTGGVSGNLKCTYWK